MPAYDSIREVDKLLDLLRKGHRPARVIFIDGLNDVSTFAWSRYPALEKLRTQGLLIDRGEVPLIFGYPRANNMIAALTFSFPVVQLAVRLRAGSIGRGADQPKRMDRDPLDWQELMVFYLRWDELQFERQQELAQEVVQHYAENLRFLRRLEDAFGFEAHVVYQPIGLLEEHQPFHREAFLGSKVQEIYRSVRQRVGQAIRQGRLDMLDCSNCVSGEPLSYVDAAHYSPRGNQRLARCILSGL